MISEILARVRFLIFRKRPSELDDEVRFHLEQSIAAKVADGVSASDARRQAMIEFGGIETTREQTDRQRPGWWAGIISQDVRYAMRGIAAHRWFSAAIVATLALGIGLNTMVFTLVYAVLLKPVPVPNGDRLVSVMGRNLSKDDDGLPFSYPDFQDYRAQASSFEFFEAVSPEAGVLSEAGNPAQQYELNRATTGIFTMLATRAYLGRAFLPSDELPGATPVLVIGYSVWMERYAGLPSVIGREVHVNGQPATIIGVMPKGFRYPDKVDLWMPLVATADLATRDSRSLQGYAILKPRVTLKMAEVELNGIAERIASQVPADKGFGMSVLTFQQRFNGGHIQIVFLLMLAAVGFVLLIACADVANMMLSRSLNRQREMSIRSALGASRWRIVRQLLIESVLLSTLGGILGLGLAESGIHWFDLTTAAFRPAWILFTMNYTVFGYFAALCILSGLLFGILPALRSSKTNLVDVLKEGTHIAKWVGDNMALVVESATDPLQAMRKTVQSLDDDLPLNQPSHLNAAIADELSFLRIFGAVFLAFALGAMLMASVGIYAVIAHATASRTREIGVRIALGATMRNILLLVMRRGLWQITCGLALGLVGAFPLTHLMASIPDSSLHSDPSVIFEVALTLALVGVFACWLPARRATGLDPMRAIRYE